jgi:hypothetical protein
MLAPHGEAEASCGYESAAESEVRFAVTDEPQIIWRCPACGKRVLGHRPYVSALEGEDRDAEFGSEGAPVALRPVSFHEGHFRPRTRGRVYLIADAEEEQEPSTPLLDAIRVAYDALGQGEIEPLVALMDRDMHWRGRRSGLQFWRPPPS